MRRLTLRAFALAAVLPSMAAAQIAEPLIEMIPSDNGITITGIVTGFAPGVVQAEISIDKNDMSGSVTTRQSREITVSQNSRDIIATAGLSAGPEARLIVNMTLTSDGKVIGRAQNTLGPQD